MFKNSSKKVIEFRPRVVSEQPKPLCSEKELREYGEMDAVISMAESEKTKMNQVFARRIKEGGYSLPAGFYFDEIMGLTALKEEAVAAR